MRHCVRCDHLTPMDEMTHMEGVIWLHNDLDTCELNKLVNKLGRLHAWRIISKR